ncbi:MULTISPECIES: hypothetical protein [Eubacteriales]|uniref:Uncharacterized protein n=1 Tax=Bittarella massiliensis (ex Durand et al. 2017) TaxID=1720313 RepID=A0AAQ1MDB5_9FIRM|nr:MULTISPECIES: hypothetical protein [Eubacteriales]MZL69062.1 hypothetical protein [Bittarella massiliensis (ex Durand et al. 2017)]MZL79918.1 hypothetical protein [Bittarella massiliensis (ex Durand et al. 2017)]SHG10929.1 hypothetical protein SAMN05444424_1505 [Bittarella massiliensis (ex Durand et al. 2017)]
MKKNLFSIILMAAFVFANTLTVFAENHESYELNPLTYDEIASSLSQATKVEEQSVTLDGEEMLIERFVSDKPAEIQPYTSSGIENREQTVLIGVTPRDSGVKDNSDWFYNSAVWAQVKISYNVSTDSRGNEAYRLVSVKCEYRIDKSGYSVWNKYLQVTHRGVGIDGGPIVDKTSNITVTGTSYTYTSCSSWPAIVKAGPTYLSGARFNFRVGTSSGYQDCEINLRIIGNIEF